MALQTYELRLLDKIGEALSADLGLDTEMFDDWLTEGARVIIGKMPAPLWRFFGSEPSAFAPTTGIVVENFKVKDVFRNDGTRDQPCRRIPEFLRGRALDSDEMTYATATDPVYYIDYSTTATPTLKILPVSGTAVGKIIRVLFPTIDASGDSSVNGFPNDLEPLLLLYALMQVKIREQALSRRDSQTEIEAITDSGILTALATTYTDMETALDALSTEVAKIDDVIVLASTEFDKMSAILDLGHTELLKVDDKIALGDTELLKVDETIVLANIEYDLMKTHVATAVTSISTSEDIEKGGSELNMASIAGVTGDKYLSEGMAGIQNFNGYITEARAILENAQAYINESEARKSTGAAYLNEAVLIIQNVQALAGEATARMSKGQLQISECGVRLGTAQAYLTQSTQAKGEGDTMEQRFERDIKDWIAVNLI